jgi:hypothetical protein
MPKVLDASLVVMENGLLEIVQFLAILAALIFVQVHILTCTTWTLYGSGEIDGHLKNPPGAEKSESAKEPPPLARALI